MSWRPGTPAHRRLAAAGLGLLLVALLATPAHAQAPEPADPLAQGAEGYVETPYGPLGPSDRDLLVRVRYAGLWEIPAGQMAAEKGSTEQIREVGAFIAEEHIVLDEEVVAVAAELDVAVPNEPHPDHQVFLNRMAEREGEEFDAEFVQRLREAHGEVYALIAFVRAGTQNDLIRDFTKTAEEFVGRHMDYLESTGLVDWFHIPPPPEPHGTKSRFLSMSPAGVHPLLIWLILGVAATAGAITVVRTVRPR